MRNGRELSIAELRIIMSRGTLAEVVLAKEIIRLRAAQAPKCECRWSPVHGKILCDVCKPKPANSCPHGHELKPPPDGHDWVAFFPCPYPDCPKGFASNRYYYPIRETDPQAFRSDADAMNNEPRKLVYERRQFRVMSPDVRLAGENFDGYAWESFEPPLQALLHSASAWQEEAIPCLLRLRASRQGCRADMVRATTQAPLP